MTYFGVEKDTGTLLHSGWRQQRFLAVVVVLSCLTIGVTYLIASGGTWHGMSVVADHGHDLRGIQMMLQARRLRRAIKYQVFGTAGMISVGISQNILYHIIIL